MLYAGSDYRQLLKNTAIALLLCVALVTLCYFFVDRPVAIFVHNQGLPAHPFLKWLTYAPPIVERWVPVALVALMIRRAWGPFRHGELAILAGCLSLVLAEQFRESISYVFGRYWPETWVDNNPSLIGDDQYGFHPFHAGPAYGSFPSGHTARTVSVAAVLWIAYPRWRWVFILASASIVAGLLGMDYHFVGDVVGGAFVGGIVGTFTARYLGLAPEMRPDDRSRDAPLLNQPSSGQGEH